MLVRTELAAAPFASNFRGVEALQGFLRMIFIKVVIGEIDEHLSASGLVVQFLVNAKSE